MAHIWDTAYTLELWLRVEVAAAEGWALRGEVPSWALQAVRGATIDPERAAFHEEETQHDMVGFLRAVNDSIGPEAARFVHLGLTSSDVKDTALSLQLIESLDLLIEGTSRLRETVGKRALEHRDTPMIGRTHGVHAEPITFGFKLAVWYDELRRALEALGRVRRDVGVAKLAGAVGTHANVPPEVEESAAGLLGLRPAAAETQIIQRDRHARYVLELATLATSLDKMATEIRALQRTDIGEVEEAFAEGQAGSSAMPHKRNPMRSERVTGIARVLRGYTGPALEDMVLWHERDLTHSSTERLILPSASILADYSVHLLNRVIGGLRVFPDRMRTNVDATRGLIFSQRVLRALLDAGVGRDDAYRTVQRGAMMALERGVPFRDILARDEEVARHLDEKQLDDLFDYSHFLRNVSTTFERVGLGGGG